MLIKTIVKVFENSFKRYVYIHITNNRYTYYHDIINLLQADFNTWPLIQSYILLLSCQSINF